MGRRPSMFSRNYRNQLRKRRIRYATSISVILAIFLIMIFYGNFRGVALNIRSSMATVFTKNNKEPVNDEKIEKKETEQNETNTTEEIPLKTGPMEEQFSLTLNSKENINLIYLVEEEKKEFKEITGSKKVTYSISPSKDKIVICDNSTQDLYITDLNKNLSNITKGEYISTKQQVFKKENVLSQIPNYIWAEKPAFIDETHIAYSSNLPWINNSGTKYLWIIDTTTGQHKSYTKIKGNNFLFGDLTEKGLTLIVDNTTMYIDINGNVTM